MSLTTSKKKLFKGVIKIIKVNKEQELVLTREKNGYAVFDRCPIHSTFSAVGLFPSFLQATSVMQDVLDGEQGKVFNGASVAGNYALSISVQRPSL